MLALLGKQLSKGGCKHKPEGPGPTSRHLSHGVVQHHLSDC